MGMKHMMISTVAGTLIAAAAVAAGAPKTIPAAPAAREGRVTKIDLQPGKDRVSLLITHTGEGKFRLFKSEKQGNVIIEAENLVVPPNLTKLVDASSSDGPVMEMTPYNSQHAGHAMAKLVLQLRGRADVLSTDLPGKFLVDITRKAGPQPLSVSVKLPTAGDEVKARVAAAQKGEQVARKLIEVLSAPQEDKHYFGSKVTFEAKDAEVPDIFRLVGESSDLNIIWDPDVEAQKTSLAVKDLPWDQLLDIVIQQKGLRAAVMGNVVRIMTVETFNKQAEARKKEISLSDELEPVIMAVIPLGFTAATDMKKLIEALVQQKDGSSPGGGGPAPAPAANSPAAAAAQLNQDFKRGKIEVDDRTNSLVLTNTKDSIERIRRLVKELDVPVPQVLIDSKVVVATESFSKTMGTSWKMNLLNDRFNAGTCSVFNGQSCSLSGGDKGEVTTTDFSVSAKDGGNSVLGFGFGTSSTAQVRAALALSEINGQSKTIASPRVIVNNNQQADISDGFTLSQLVPGGATGPSGAKELNPKLSLSVKPQVTSHGSVQLKALTITKDSVNTFSATTATLDTKRITTDVLVDSGATLVLGGIYQLEQGVGRDGIPVLMDLPFIGQLFRVDTTRTNKTELMVFITPQIIDPEAGSQSL